MSFLQLHAERKKALFEIIFKVLCYPKGAKTITKKLFLLKASSYF